MPMADRRVDGRARRTRTTQEPGASSTAACRNQLLGLLPPIVLDRLKPHLTLVRLVRGDVLFRAREPLQVVHFPETAVVSFVSRLESGETLDVGLVGRDGLAATAVFPGITTMSCDGIVHIPGLSHRISADVLRQHVTADDSLRSTLGRFVHLLLGRSMQLSICNRFHSVEQRCIRRLLVVNDLITDAAIPLTHELLATMLGVHRPTVTLVIRALNHAGLVVEERGRIVIRDRRRLEAACCECYRLMRNEQLRLLGY